MSEGLAQSIYRGEILRRGFPALPCLVRDLKPKGARLMVEFTPPPAFWLVVDEMRLNVYCQVVARSPEGVEVEFS